MTQYMLSVHSTEEDHTMDFNDPELQARFAATGAFNEKLVEAGVYVFANGLQAASTATMVRAHEGDLVITDGPYLETKEHIGGFWIIDVPDLDVALKLAEEASQACVEPVEVRPFQTEPEA